MASTDISQLSPGVLGTPYTVFARHLMNDPILSVQAQAGSPFVQTSASAGKSLTPAASAAEFFAKPWSPESPSQLTATTYPRTRGLKTVTKTLATSMSTDEATATFPPPSSKRPRRLTKTRDFLTFGTEAAKNWPNTQKVSTCV